MELETLSCNHCGGSLEVSASANFVRCDHCGSRLAVKRTGSATYTEVLDRIGSNTERISENVEVVRLQNELERIDREWQIQREHYQTRSEDGSAANVPRESGSVAGVFGIIFTLGVVGVFIFIAASAASSSAGSVADSSTNSGFSGLAWVLVLFGVLALIMVIAGVVSSSNKASIYSKAEGDYLARRAEIARHLDARSKEI